MWWGRSRWAHDSHAHEVTATSPHLGSRRSPQDQHNLYVYTGYIKT